MLDAGLIAVEGRDDAGGVDPGLGFDADDGRAEIGHGAADGGAGDDPREVEHFDPVEGGRALGGRFGHQITPSSARLSISALARPSSR